MISSMNIEAGLCVLTLKGERRKGVPARLFAIGCFIPAAHLLVYRSAIRFGAEVVGVTFAACVVLRQQFGTSVLTVTETHLMLKRHTFGIGRTRQFPRSDIEKLGYEPTAGADDAALAVVVRTAMMPIRFAHGITPIEANEVLMSVQKSGSWLGPMIRPVGTALF
jgi:hypothetical protein